ncbi:MAG: hypothetical protein J0L97_05480, partial [Alphaproteobacteria bacterium]|nr:hypothetical protein [Alphaproteobacteria bacterium]
MLAWFHSLSIQRKLVLLITGICTVALLLSSAINIAYQWRNLTSQALKRLEITANVMAVQSRAALEF